MAGIGFELKKIFKERGLFVSIKGYLYSTIVIVGPFLLCTIMVTLLQLILKEFDTSFYERQLFLAATVYAFIFSQIVTSGFTMIITRYISDKLYAKELEKILSSLYGLIILCLVIGAVPGIIFYIKSPLNFYFKISAYVLYMQLMIMWIQAVYLTALKDYFKIVLAFFSGVCISVGSAVILLFTIKMEHSLLMLIAMNVGILTTITIMQTYLQKFLKGTEYKFFEFISYFDKYPSLFFINLFYTLAIYCHNFLFWNSSIKDSIGATYVYASLYDVATFFALLTIAPSLVIFVVSVETSFYDKYRDYYFLVTEGGNFQEIESAKKDMKKVLWQEMVHLMDFQTFCTVVSIVVGSIILPRLGVLRISIDIFRILCIGAYGNIITLIITLLLLYFEDRKGALYINATFLLTNIIFTKITIYLGDSFYGLGFLLSSLIAMVLSLLRMRRFIEDINYNTFCSQPVIYKEKKGVFSWISTRIYES